MIMISMVYLEKCPNFAEHTLCKLFSKATEHQSSRRMVRFPPPPLLKTSDCLWLATPPIASDQIVTVVGSARRRFVEFGDGVFES